MRTLLRTLMAVALAVAATAVAAAPGSARSSAPDVTVALTSDGSTLAWSPTTVEAERPGAVVRVDLDTTAVQGVRSDLVRLALETDGSAVQVSAPGPFGGADEVAAASEGAPGEGVVQVDRIVPLSLTFAASGEHRVRLTAVVPGRDATLRASVDLVLTTAAGDPEVAHEAPVPSSRSTFSTESAMRQAGAAAPASRSRAGQSVVVDEGHVDMGPRMVDGTWRIQLKDDTVSPAVWRELSDVVLHAVDATKGTVPAGEQFGFLGPAGSDVWLLPQAQQAGIVWPGWNTQDPSISSVATGPVTWTLRGVDGPGAFALFLTGSFGTPEVIFDSDRPLPQQHPIALGTHVHGNWAFTEAGTYRLEVEMSAPTGSGTVTDTRTLTFAVGVAPTNPGGGAGSPTTTRSGAGAPGASQEVSTSRGASGSPSPGGGAPSGMADTGIASLTAKVLLGLGLVMVGAAALTVRRRREFENESHS